MLNASWILFIVCLICLLLLIFATIFNRNFRQDIVAQEGQASFLGFSLQGVTIIIFIGLFLAVSWDVSGKLQGSLLPLPPPIHPAEKAIRNFYKEVNLGIENYGTERGLEAFIKSWELLTPEYQSDRARKFPSHNFPDEFGLLYKETEPIEILAINQIEGTDTIGYKYFVIYRVTEDHIYNPIYDYFAQTTQKRFGEIKQEVSKFEDEILNALENNFDLEAAAESKGITKEDLISQIRTLINRQFMNRIISHRLLTEISEGFKIPFRGESPDPSDASLPSLSSYLTYNTFESQTIKLKKVNNAWKIDKISLVSLYAQPRN